MPSMYENLVARLGEDGAREEMRRRRGFVKKPGFASMSKKKHLAIAKKGAAAAKKVHEAKYRAKIEETSPYEHELGAEWELDEWEKGGYHGFGRYSGPHHNA